MIRVLALAVLLVAACARPSAHASRVGPPAPAEPYLAYGVELPLALTGLEEEAVRAARSAGARAEISPALVLAARELARAAAAGGGDPLAARRVRAALTGAAAFDPSPRARLVAGDLGQIARALAGDLPDGTHLGIGGAKGGDRTWLVALSSRRKARLSAFPRDLALGAEHELQAMLIGLDAARAVVTLPSGATREVLATVGAAGRSLRATLRFDEPGAHVVELLGDGPHGPEVAAILTVHAGEQATSASQPSPSGTGEPDDIAASERRVEEALNALRRAQRLAPVTYDAALKAVARRHSEEMRSNGILAHVLPGTGDLAARLRRAGIAYRAAGENVARGRTALEAHQVAEESPAHRRNMLDAKAQVAGVGISRGILAGGERVVYLTEILLERGTPRPAGADARREVREAAQRARVGAGLPPLDPDPALDALAQRAASEMARSGARRERRLASEALELEGRHYSGADAILSASPQDAARSEHAVDRRFRRFGVGVAPSSTAPGTLWMAIAYTD